MILDVLSFRDKKITCWSNPFFTQDKVENIATSLQRTIILGGEEVKKKYEKKALYRFGTFDDVSGKYDLLESPELIVDCDDIIASIPEVK